MDKINEFLKSLLSTCSEELHLEPEKNPYLVSVSGATDVTNVPLLGTQISMMVFPLIPPETKAALPHNTEVEFVYSNELGNFGFLVQKSPAGFNVTIRPMLSDVSPNITMRDTLPTQAPTIPMPAEVPFPAVEPQTQIAPEPNASQYVFESASAGVEYNPDVSVLTDISTELVLDDPVAQSADNIVFDSPNIEVVSVSDPEYTTVFSDSAGYEPPARRDDFTGEYLPPTFDQPAPAAIEPPQPPVAAVPPPYEPPPQMHPPTPPQPPPSQIGFAPSVSDPQMAARMDALFVKMSEVGASDLHMSVSVPPMVRQDGKMKPLESAETVLTRETMQALLMSIMPARNQQEFAERSDTDFAYEIPGLARFRCNIYMDRKGMGAVFRIIPSKILTAEQLNLSKAIMDLCSLSKGLVVVTGPTGSGKSTTLCAMVDSINKSREDHIITIEDPIEFVHENQKCLVNQREVHNHTDSFKNALRAALREDPDIVLVGEMRDLETISIAIETAETGHLVFGTLHTTTAASTVDRIIDQFPADRQQQIRVMLSESLRGVIAQTLLPKKGGGRVAALEVLIVTPAISNLIREGKTFQIPSAMQTGKNLGMVMLNDALFEHVQNGSVEPRDAYVKSVDKASFETMLTRAGISL